MKAKNDRAAWFEGGVAHCSIPPVAQAQPRRLVLLGAPGVGKGTQAELLCQHFGTCHLSTGDVFRAAKKCATPHTSQSMAEALACMQRGELVPDLVVLNLILERTPCLRCGGGFLLDGFPRTVAQARVLEELLKADTLQLDAVLDYKLPRKALMARLCGRRTCPNCKESFHVDALPPKIAGICDHCGGVLFQREDDRPESVRVRLAAYAKNSGPLKRFYQRRNLLVTIAAAGTPEETLARTLAALETRWRTCHEPELICE